MSSAEGVGAWEQDVQHPGWEAGTWDGESESEFLQGKTKRTEELGRHRETQAAAFTAPGSEDSGGRGSSGAPGARARQGSCGLRAETSRLRPGVRAGK